MLSVPHKFIPFLHWKHKLLALWETTNGWKLCLKEKESYSSAAVVNTAFRAQREFELDLGAPQPPGFSQRPMPGAGSAVPHECGSLRLHCSRTALLLQGFLRSRPLVLSVLLATSSCDNGPLRLLLPTYSLQLLPAEADRILLVRKTITGRSALPSLYKNN